MSLDIDVKKAFENETDLAALLKIDKEKLAEIRHEFQGYHLNRFPVLKKPEINQELFDKVYGQDVVKSKEEFNQKVDEELKACI